jgi:hypothetical protein
MAHVAPEQLYPLTGCGMAPIPVIWPWTKLQFGRRSGPGKRPPVKRKADGVVPVRPPPGGKRHHEGDSPVLRIGKNTIGYLKTGGPVINIQVFVSS